MILPFSEAFNDPHLMTSFLRPHTPTPTLGQIYCMVLSCLWVMVGWKLVSTKIGTALRQHLIPTAGYLPLRNRKRIHTPYLARYTLGFILDVRYRVLKLLQKMILSF